MDAQGETGLVAFDGQYVTISRNTMLGRSTVGKGEKRLHVAQVSAVQWKPAGSVVNGFIQFTLPGGNERRSQFGSQTNYAARDENSVVFTKKQQPEFAKLRAALDEAIAAQHSSTPPSAPTPPLVAELTKLAGLLESGVLTKEEFQQAKAHLLGQ